MYMIGLKFINVDKNCMGQLAPGYTRHCVDWTVYPTVSGLMLNIQHCVAFIPF